MIATEEPQGHAVEALAVTSGERFARRPEVVHRRDGGRSPRDIRHHLEREQGDGVAPELGTVDQHPDRAGARVLDHTDRLARGAAFAMAGDLVPPLGRVARHPERVPCRRRDVERREKAGVALGRRSYPEAAARGQRRQLAHEHLSAATAADRQLVPELAIEPGNAGDRVHHVATGGAPRVVELELRAHEPAAAIRGPRAHELRLADGNAHAAVRPRVREQEHRGDDGARPRVLDDRRVGRARDRMPALDEVARPLAEIRLRLGHVLTADDVGVERGERVGIGRRRGPEDQAVAEITGHGRHGIDECSAL